MPEEWNRRGHVPACPLPIYASPPTRRQVDAYMFPCPHCGPAAAQVKSLFDYWVANGVNVTRVWLDIEGTSYWLGNADSNRVHPPMLPPPPAAPPPCPPPHPTAAGMVCSALRRLRLHAAQLRRLRCNLPAACTRVRAALTLRSFAVAVERNFRIVVVHSWRARAPVVCSLRCKAAAPAPSSPPCA